MEEPHNYNQLAVEVKNVCKSYDKGTPILSNLCMNVKKGTIYGLLGSSGCGKTTLLSSVIGLKKWDSGEIFLFGKKVSGTPGKFVGFMPQDVALHTPLSVKEVLEYYCRLYGMTKTDSEKQCRSLAKLLQLPSKMKLIKDLSGGQKRRVSLAVTLIHRPKLLILDEPTAGVDPLLRDGIWKHFRNAVETEKVTVIVTTHYIEETLSSDTVGVLRNGRLLAEDSPRSLLQKYDCDLLEQVVLKLCHADEYGTQNNNNTSRHSHQRLMDDKRPILSVSNRFQEDEKSQSRIESRATDRIIALSNVIWRIFARHDVFLMMILILPTFILMISLAILGSPPRDLKFGVVNQDLSDNHTCFYKNGTFEIFENEDCQLENLSCGLIYELSRSGIMNLIPIESDQIAKQLVTLGRLLGYFSFPSNYSHHVANFVAENKFAENETLDGSRIHLTMDMSNYISTSFVIRDAFEAYERFSEKTALNCLLNPFQFQLPMTYREPIYGSNGKTLHEYYIPVIIQSIGFVFPMLMTSLIFINDRKQGTLDRARVAGVEFKEVMISHTITQGSVIIVQTAISFAVLFLFYGIRVQGSYPLFFILCILGGFSGQALGLIVGVVFQEEAEAFMIGVFMMFVVYVLQGFLWPLEGMTFAMRCISYTLPTTLLIEGIRSVVFRGVGLFSGFVLPGVTITVCWTIIFWVVSMSLFRWKQKFS